MGGGAHAKTKTYREELQVLHLAEKRGPGTQFFKGVYISSEEWNQCLDEKYEASVYKSQSLNLDPLQFLILVIEQSLCSRLCLDKHTFTRSICHLYSLCISTHPVYIRDFVWNLFVQPAFFHLFQCTHGGSAFVVIHERWDPPTWRWSQAKLCLQTRVKVHVHFAGL